MRGVFSGNTEKTVFLSPALKGRREAFPFKLGYSINEA
jgi:hypothetical protein